MPRKLFMVVEKFKNNDAVPVYRRFKERGRMAPEGLNYISSWVDHDLTRLLIARGADVNLADRQGVTPLAHAEQGGQRAVGELLREAEARGRSRRL